MWEDDKNKKGGRWLINLNKQQRSTDLDNFWLEMVRIHICLLFGLCLVCKVELFAFVPRIMYDGLIYERTICFQLLCLIGEAFEEYSDEISGAVVNIRNKGDKLGLWTQDASRSEATKRIGWVKNINVIRNLPHKMVCSGFPLALENEEKKFQSGHSQGIFGQ